MINAFDKARLYYHTVRFLKPVQIQYQIRNRLHKGRGKKFLKKIKESHIPEPDYRLSVLIPELDKSKDSTERFDVQGLLSDQLCLLHEKHHMDWKHWKAEEASHLWNFNLHYLEFLVPLANQFVESNEKKYLEKWEEIICSWMQYCGNGNYPDAFESYTISLRVPNVLISMELLGDKLQENIQKDIINSIFIQYRYLEQAQELALLANHYFENLKTLVLCSLLFADYERYQKYFHKFLGQIREQILPDGVHYELSWMYHKIILEDILRVYKGLISVGKKDDAFKLVETIQRMANASASFEKGMGQTPLFNDSGNNVAKKSSALIEAVSGMLSIEVDDSITSFQNAGYYKLYKGDVALSFDCGRLGPGYMAGHGHCDCLSFELSKNQIPVLVNAGTYQYQGDKRSFFRSSAAHNTVMVDDQEQSELWGEHRAARRISKIKAYSEKNLVAGCCTSYIGVKFERNIRMLESGIQLSDTVQSPDKKAHVLRQYLHLAPGFRYQMKNDNIRICYKGKEIGEIVIGNQSEAVIHQNGIVADYAPDFGKLNRIEVLEIRTAFCSKMESIIEIKI